MGGEDRRQGSDHRFARDTHCNMRRLTPQMTAGSTDRSSAIFGTER
jgi:hypothetical protein